MESRMKVVAMMAALMLVPAGAQADKGGRNRYEVLESKCSNGAPRNCIRYAVFVRRGQLVSWQVDWLYRVPGCESHWNPYAQNASGSSGLYQFLPSTWATTPYSRYSIWAAKWQSLAAAWMVIHGRSGEWTCK